MSRIALPPFGGREKTELLEILLREEYGFLPPAAVSVHAEAEGKIDERFAAGKAGLARLRLTCRASFGDFSFPVFYACPKRTGPYPAFVHINFRDLVPDRYQPTEEILDRGFAVLTFCYQDITADNADFTSGLAGVVYPGGKRPADGCGKIGLWAWAAMRVMDYAMTLPELDHGKISVIGHSRLGKTALLTGALDERFYCAFSNDSGCSGAALARGNSGETVEKICRVFPYWFCENYYRYGGNEQDMPFDQHFLIAANYPHRVYVASAAEDLWACPENEFAACVAADEFYTARGKAGLGTVVMPPVGGRVHTGYIGYHDRAGCHYLSREDWNAYMDYLQAQFASE